MSIAETLTVLLGKAHTKRGAKGRKATDDKRPAFGEAEIAAFAQRLKDLMATDQLVLAGSIQMIGLAQLRAHFGNRWGGLSDKVHALVRSVIDKRTFGHDIHARLGEDTYVIVFGRMQAEAARMKGALIAEEIARKIFGDSPPADLIQVGVASLSPDGAPGETLGLEDSARAANRIAASRQGTVIDVPAPVPAPSKPPAHRTNGNVEAGGADAPTGGDPNWARSDTGDSGPAPAWKCLGEDEPEPPDEWRRVGPEEREFTNEWRRIGRDEPDFVHQWRPIANGGLSIPPDLRFVYQPAWLVNRQVISAHTFLPARVAEDGNVVAGGAAMPFRLPTAENYALDLLGLMKVVRNLHQMAKARAQASVIFPIHLQTLDLPRHRKMFTEYAVSVPDDMRAKLLFEVMGISDTTPASTIANAVSTLRPLCRNVLVRARLETRNMSDLLALGVHAVGIDLGNLGWPEKDIFPLLSDFNVRAQKSRLCTFVHGISTRSLLSGSVAAGFRYLDGCAVATPADFPMPNRRWTPADVYSTLLNSS